MPTAKIERLDTARFAQILSVALEEFAQYRYRDASFNRIIKNCGLAKGTMYYYFKSKDDLFLTIHKATLRDFRRLAQLSGEDIADAPSFWDLADELLLEFYRCLYRKRATTEFVNNFLTRESRSEGHPALDTVAAIDSWLEAFLKRGQELGALRSDLTLSQMHTLAWGLWESCRSFFPSEANQMKAEVHPRTLIDLFRRSLGPSPETILPTRQDPLPRSIEF